MILRKLEKIRCRVVVGRVLRARAPSAMAGRSMIEMLGVLAIIGVLSAGGIWAYSVAMEDWKAKQMINDVRNMAVQVMQLTAKQPKITQSATLFNAEALYRLGIVPEKYKKGSSFINPYTNSPTNIGVVAYSAYGYNGVSLRNAIYFYTDMTNENKKMSKAMCVKFFTFPWAKEFPLGVNFSIYYTGAWCLAGNRCVPATKEKIEDLCQRKKGNLYFNLFLRGQPY